MRFKKTTLAALCLAFASAAAYAAAGDRFFSNPTSNKDVVIQVNKAGVTTDVVKAVGATGAVTLGPSAGLTGTPHRVRGPLFIDRDGTGTNGGSVTGGAGSSEYNGNFYRDPSSGVAAVTGTGYTRLRVIPTTSSGAVALSLETNITSQTANTTVTGTETNIGSATSGGVWTLGPSSLGSAHAINGGISIKGGPSIRQMAPQTGAINADGGNGFVNFSFSIAVLDTAKTSCTANIKDGSGSYLGAAIACDMVDSISCRCRVTGRTSGTVQALLMEWY